jgi:hypothetical protein
MPEAGISPMEILRCGHSPDLLIANPLYCHPGHGQRMQFNQRNRREFITLLGGASDNTIGRTLKKTFSSRIASSNG